LSPGEVWTLDRGVFQQIMMQTGMKKIEEKLNFLKSVPIFSKMSNDILLRLSDALEVVSNISLHGRRKVHERILVIWAAQPGPNGQLSRLHSFKIF
jgi:hypothetical protein